MAGVICDSPPDKIISKVDYNYTFPDYISSHKILYKSPRYMALKVNKQMPIFLKNSPTNYIDGNLYDLKWKAMGPGLSQVRLWTGPNDERLWLLRAKAGTTIPMHDHRSLELTLVLQGSYQANGERFKPGMIEVADEHTHSHQPIIDEGEECICLVVTEAPIKIHSLIGKVVQPFIGL